MGISRPVQWYVLAMSRGGNGSLDICGVVLLLVLILLVGDYGPLTLTAYNSTTVPPRSTVPIEH